MREQTSFTRELVANWGKLHVTNRPSIPGAEMTFRCWKLCAVSVQRTLKLNPLKLEFYEGNSEIKLPFGYQRQTLVDTELLLCTFENNNIT